jgi:hypothetical protein
MIDLTRQIEAYAEQLDLAVAPPEELLERRRLGKPPVSTRPRGWVAAAAAAGAAAVVLVAVGVVAINRGDNLVTNSRPPSTTQATANTTTTNAPTVLRFESATETPAFDTGGPEEWDSPYVSPGAVIYQDGIYHMLRNGFGDEKPTGVGYGVSDNGVLWGEVGAEPVFSLEGGQVHTGLVASDGNWIVYFDSQLNKDDEETRYRTIGRASAPGPEGPWVVDSDPVLVPGGAGAWDQSLVQQPSVIETSNGFVMYYTGAGKDGYAIGRATSSDGIEWVKDDQPVLTPDSEWEGSELTRPDVVVTEDGLVMMYGNRSGSHRGIATSRDGLTWTRFSGNPVLDTRAVPRATMMTGELFYRDGVYLLYLENGGTFSTTNIAVLTRDAPIQIR